MGVVYILLLIQGITVEIVLYQPQNIVSVEVNRTAVITCVSSEVLDAGLKISWYHRKWRSSEAPILVKSCSSDDDPQKYVCKNEKYKAWLEIHNVQITDSGVYYCMHKHIPYFPQFGNETKLNVRDKSTSRSSIHILGHLQPQHYNSSLLLACVVLVAQNTVHLHWNISGTYYKGQIISREKSNGTWTVINFISLPKDNWDHGDRVTCEAWITSSPTSVHWEIPGQDESNGYVASKCQDFMIPVVTAGTLLVLTLLIHLSRTIKLSDKTAHKDPVMEDQIAYAELNINRLTRLKKTTQTMNSKNII
ncbi:uncharacterized protein LOC120982227 isoform X1 [Bufo bufo]|uniref:uncharacterized protein LOC120982227 isoform X1 n=1 Tax=Bufo bufo TaxID=8384 RepID=UPI001ABE32E8|nr:uncharacterized protein LOC120982227 isoform X1 [Bufo bufo]